MDYDPASFPSHAADAELLLRQRLVTLVRQRRDVVVDFAFWRRATRDRYKRLVENAGGAWSLVYLKAEPAELCRRLHLRAQRLDANAAFQITPELLDAYLADFEEPADEGEQIIVVPTLADE